MASLMFSAAVTLCTLVLASSLNSIERERPQQVEASVSFEVKKQKKIKARKKVRKKKKKLKDIRQAPPISPSSIPTVDIELEMPSVSKEDLFDLEEELQVATQPPVPSPSNPMPAYPYDARSAGTQGKVIVRVLVDEYGFVIKSRILQSDKNFDDEVLKVIGKWKFTPAKSRSGSATEKWLDIPFNFVL